MGGVWIFSRTTYYGLLFRHSETSLLYLSFLCFLAKKGNYYLIRGYKF